MILEQMEGQELAGRFLLQRLVGQGGYGAVFEAEQLSVGRRCAVKVLLPDQCENEAISRRFAVEARAISQLVHTNSVVLYDFGQSAEHNGLLFLAMEFLEGRDLNQLIEDEGQIALEPTVHIARQIGGSLYEAHSQGLVHRDVKPHNVMLIERHNDPYFVKVIDFGIAKALQSSRLTMQELTQAGTMIGTPHYMAPEQVLDREVDGRADQYALATTLYKMLAGRTPFQGITAIEVASKQISENPLPVSTYRKDLRSYGTLDAVLLRALSKKPAERYADIMEFVDAFAKAALMSNDQPYLCGESTMVDTPSVQSLDVRPSVVQPAVGVLVLSEERPSVEALVSSGERISVEVSAASMGFASDEQSSGELLSSTIERSSDELFARPVERNSGELLTSNVGLLSGDESKEAFIPATMRVEAVTAQTDMTFVGDEAPGSTLFINQGFNSAEIQAAANERSQNLARHQEQAVQRQAQSEVFVENPRKNKSAERTISVSSHKWLVGTALILSGVFMLLLSIVVGRVIVTHFKGKMLNNDGIVAEKADNNVEAQRRKLKTTVTSSVVEPVVEALEAKEEVALDTESTVAAGREYAETVNRRAQLQVAAWQEQQKIALAEETAAAEKAAQAKKQMARVRVTLIPWGKLYVNQRAYTDKPRQDLRLAPGRYTFILKQGADEKVRKTVDVGAGSNTMVELVAK